MELNENIMKPCSSSSIPGSVEYTNAIEATRICPLCASEIKQFFINLNEKVLLCENNDCEFPFGYEDLQFSRVDDVNDTFTSGSKNSQSNMSSTVHSSSLISTPSWSEVEKMCRGNELEDNQTETRAPYDFSSTTGKMNRRKNKLDLIMRKNVEDIKGLNVELEEIQEPRKIIKNQKWIKNLMSLEDRSGMTLLKPEELKQLEKDKNELKINIDQGDSSNMSSIEIKIQIRDK